MIVIKTGQTKRHQEVPLSFIEDNFEFSRRKNIPPSRPKRRARFISMALDGVMVVLVVMIAYEAIKLGRYYFDLQQNSRAAEKAQDIYFAAMEQGQENALEAESFPTENTPQATLAVTEAPVSKREVFIRQLQEDFSNPDIFAYLVVEGTAISYPVAHGTDNDFYINHDLYGRPNVAGAVFMDMGNATGMDDPNTIFYGHNMKNGSMFHNLRFYEDYDYFQEHRYIQVVTAQEDMDWEIFAFYATDTSFPYIRTDFYSPDDFYSLAMQMKERSFYDTGVDITKEDIILTLSTCTNRAEDSRYVINARLMVK